MIQGPAAVHDHLILMVFKCITVLLNVILILSIFSLILTLKFISYMIIFLIRHLVKYSLVFMELLEFIKP